MPGEVGFVTKILVPRRRPETVRRPRLLDTLGTGAGGRLAVVRAPAGFGKTTLMVDLAHEATAGTCWISLDEWDRDTGTFVQYFRASVLRRLGSPAAKGVASLTAGEPRIVVGELTNRLAGLDEETWIFLDDFHALEGSEDVLGLIDYFVRRLPLSCRLFVASRTPPALPSLARMAVEGRALEAGPEELAFTIDEIRSYYRVARGQDIPPAEAERVLNATQGWPAAVALSDPSVRLEEKQRPPSVLMSDYLGAEIYQRLPDELQRFLLLTSVFDTLEEDGCEAVLHEVGVAAQLERLESENVPLLSVEGAIRQFKVHPLLRDFLHRKLRGESRDLYRRLHLDAAAWELDRGRSNEAIWHLAQGEDWDQVAATIQEEAPKVYKLGRWQTVVSWLEAIPPEQLGQRRRLLLWKARVLARLGQADQALQIVTEALERSDSDPTLAAQVETVKASALRLKGELEWALASSRRAVDLAVKCNAPIDVVSEARKELGLALAAAGSFSEAAKEFRGVLDVCEQRGDVEETAFVSGCLGSALVSLGKLSESIPHLEESRRQWRRVGNNKELSWVVNNLAMIYYLMGHFELARELFEEALTKARAAGHQRIEAYSLISLADIDRQMGDYQSSVERCEQALSLADDLGQPTLSVLALTGLAHTFRQMGDLRRAEMLARQALASAEERKSSYEQGLAHMALGRLAKRAGRAAEAISSLTAAVTLFEGVSAHRELAEALYFLADASFAVGRSRTALREALEKLARVVRDLGHHQFLLQAVEEAPAAARYVASRKIEGTFYRELLRRLESRRAEAPSVAPKRSALGGTFPVVQVAALGRFEVRMDGRKILDFEWESEKTRELLLLLLTLGHPLRRDEIAAALWPESGGSRAVSSFHSCLYRLRRALYPECVAESGGAYALNPSGSFSYDVKQFERLAEQARRANESDPSSLDTLRAAVELYRGPFAPAIESEWAESGRYKLEERFLRLAGVLAERLLLDGDHIGAAHACQRVLEHDPYNEAACYKLMKAYYLSGDHEAALLAYRRFSQALQGELGEQPGEALADLYSEIRRKIGRPTI